MIRVRFDQIKAIFLLAIFTVLSIFVKKRSWIIMERGTDARDNAYHLYRYIKTKHPEKKVYYVIDRNSPDYIKVKEDAVQYGSVKNYWLVVTSKKIISSHYARCLPNIGSKLFKISGLYKKFYFLQHGVIANDLVFLHRQNAPMKLFCCGAKPEYEYVKKNFGHPDGVIHYTGLARYDNLHGHKSKNEILVMPTWRKYLSGLSKSEFKRSEYYIRWNRVLNNSNISVFLKENNFKLIFYPHYEMQKYLDCFTCEDKNVIIANFNEYDVQRLLIDAKVLITDYSSVFFDFAYMKKPCIYYQFDKIDYYAQHYHKGYFDYDKSGFGEVVADIDELLLAINNIVDDGFCTEKKYLERIDGFFELVDNNNCERIFNAVESL